MDIESWLEKFRKYWDLAEVFNAVIQDTDDFVKLHGKIECIGYPDHRN